ncbi:MAG: DUF6273 domain-containing protein [Corallococcus sp.]|nr:DUF6273 domain-containing protein [Corallococcus sp.]MCM1359047.1 DUF6273 domain-containing protein [Corallococcus sp.]MCM1395036.1 DUF6273 domain-containing protein [Corallococcus sp.]
MNRKILAALLLALFSVICVTGLSACANNEEYTITWKNENGDILEIDTNVKKGSIPTYDGKEPTKQSDAQYSYAFYGWEPQVSEAQGDATYTATFVKHTNKYTVVWKNYNGDILETDTDVPYGTVPAYNGDTPKKDGTEEISYVFAGWTPSVDAITGDTVYTAKFTERNSGDLIAGIDPVFSKDNKTVQYGFYPQTRVSDSDLIAELDKLAPSGTNGWYLHDGQYYAKETAKVYNNESYTFDDGTPIIDGNEYWFKCEIIEWRVLSNADGSYYLLASKLLDAHNYYADYSERTVEGKSVYANNYERSGIRDWLNNSFYNAAFALNNTYIRETTVSNAAATTDATNNKYACGDTKDKVYLPSYQDYVNSDYGFDPNVDNASLDRQCVTTDYARARGAWCNNKFNGSYWTRSPSSEYYYCAWNVNSGGYLSVYAIDGDSHCVRPSITIGF